MCAGRFYLRVFIPHDFLSQLTREFGDRLRIRWSVAKHEFHLEQRVGRAALPPFRVDEADDRTIRARDGYHFVMAVKPTNYLSCDRCNRKCVVPELRTSEIRCSCGWRAFGGYWPLGEALILHLKKIDPYRDGHKNLARESDLATERAEWLRKRAIRNHIEAATYDDKYQLFGTPFVGYTGKTFSK